MKSLLYLFTVLLIASCDKRLKTVSDNSEIDKSMTKTTDNVSKTTDDKIKLHKLEKLFVVGDFNGDGRQDTIFQHNYSRLTKTEIEYTADPFQNDWDSVVKWFYGQEVELYLTSNVSKQDTLRLGIALGLYCLINIGDNNADGKDEIALVVDYLDYSLLNSCKIYSLCKDIWKNLKLFGIHEGSFDFTTDKPPIFDNIKSHLEKQNGKWFYNDYWKDDYEIQSDVGKMLKLKIDKCK